MTMKKKNVKTLSSRIVQKSGWLTHISQTSRVFRRNTPRGDFM